MKQIVQTHKAPKASGTYSQAVKAKNTVYLSGQIPLQPDTMEMVSDDIEQQIKQVFENLKAVAEAAGGSLEDVVKLTVYLIDLKNFPLVNQIMPQYFSEPYPARTTIGVAALPKGSQVEMDVILALGD